MHFLLLFFFPCLSISLSLSFSDRTPHTLSTKKNFQEKQSNHDSTYFLCRPLPFICMLDFLFFFLSLPILERFCHLDLSVWLLLRLLLFVSHCYSEKIFSLHLPISLSLVPFPLVRLSTNHRRLTRTNCCRVCGWNMYR